MAAASAGARTQPKLSDRHCARAVPRASAARAARTAAGCAPASWPLLSQRASKAEQSKAKQSKAKQSKAKQSSTRLLGARAHLDDAALRPPRRAAVGVDGRGDEPLELLRQRGRRRRVRLERVAHHLEHAPAVVGGRLGDGHERAHPLELPHLVEGGPRRHPRGGRQAQLRLPPRLHARGSKQAGKCVRARGAAAVVAGLGAATEATQRSAAHAPWPTAASARARRSRASRRRARGAKWCSCIYVQSLPGCNLAKFIFIQVFAR